MSQRMAQPWQVYGNAATPAAGDNGCFDANKATARVGI